MIGLSPEDPYRDNKKYHCGHLMREDGSVSALCFKRPRPIDLSKALWTNRDEAVTCQRCLRAMRQKKDAEKGKD